MLPVRGENSETDKKDNACVNDVFLYYNVYMCVRSSNKILQTYGIFQFSHNM